MVYKSVSIKNVIGRVLRNTRVQDTSYIADMAEWIPEAMDYMKTKVTLQLLWKDVEIDFYKGKLPCGLKTLRAVSYKCQRLKQYNGVKPADSREYCGRPIVFVSAPGQHTVSISQGGTIRVCDYQWTIPTDNTETQYYFSKFGISNGASIAAIETYFDTTNSGTISASIVALETAMNALNFGTYTIEFNNNDEIIISSLNNPNEMSWILVQTTAAPEGIEYNAVESCQQVPVSGTTSTEINTMPSLRVDINSIFEQEYCEHTYYTELDWINTTIKCGTLRLFYMALPMDEEGYPLVPDNGNYLEAIYWYCRAKMIGAGYKDNVFKYGECDAKFELHAARAVGEIRYPSVDQVETKSQLARLIMPQDYYNTFFNNVGKENMIG